MTPLSGQLVQKKVTFWHNTHTRAMDTDDSYIVATNNHIGTC